MFKGFLSGLFWGGMVGALVLAVLSLYAPLPSLQAGTGAGAQAPAAVVGSNETASENAAKPTESDETNEESKTPVDSTTKDMTDDQSGNLVDPIAVETVTETAAVKVEPVIDINADDITFDEIDSDEVVAAAENTVPDLTNADDVSPTITASLQSPSFFDTTDISSVKLPQASDPGVETPVAPNAIKVAASEPTDRPLIITDKPISALPVAVLKTSPDALGFANDVSVQTAPRLGDVADDAPTTTTTSLVAPVISELAPEPVENPAVVFAEIRPAVRSGRLPQIGGTASADVTEASSDTPIGVQVEPIENPVSAKTIPVVTGRLPTVGSTSERTSPQIIQTNTPEDATPSRGALTDHASAFTTNAQSLFSIVIVDAGDAGVAREQLLNSSYPITVAIDPSKPDAAALMAQYRAAGIEVVALLNDLPPSAAPSDVAVAISGYFSVVDQAVAVMEPLDRRLQKNRKLLQPVLEEIANTGHGLMTYAQGLNTAQQSAKRLGVPSVAVFRVLDEEGEKSAKIKRYLKRAAFNAGRDGSVVVVGRSYDETMTAILEWALENNDASISLAPISAVLKSDIAQGS